MLKSMVNNFGLGKFYDAYGYNVLEMSYDEFLANKELVKSFVDSKDSLKARVIDEFGNEILNKNMLDENSRVIVYDIDVWVKEGLI